LHNGWWLRQSTLQIGIRGGLAVKLAFEMIDGLLLGLYLSLEHCDLVTLRFDEGSQTAGMGVAGVIRTFPWSLRLARKGWNSRQYQPYSDRSDEEIWPAA
jgi:hypothetical protein